MYEDQTKAAILLRMLDASPSDIDKRQGSITYDLLSPDAIELARAYAELDNVLRFGFADTTYGPYLDMRANELGLMRKQATAAVGSVTFSGTNGTVIPKGTQVSTGGTNPIIFTTDADVTIASGSVTAAVTASVPGASGNVGIAAVRLVLGSLSGVVVVTNNANFEGGSDVETDAAFLARYLDRVRQPITSGNANQYRQWALEVSGISDAKVYPVWNGAGTVKVVLLDDLKTAPDSTTITEVYDYIESVRPVGATVTVVGATEVPININVDVTLASGATLAGVKAEIDAAVTTYLQTLAFTDSTVRISRIASVILDAEGVLDYGTLTLNGGTTNIVITDGSVAILGTTVVT